MQPTLAVADARRTLECQRLLQITVADLNEHISYYLQADDCRRETSKDIIALKSEIASVQHRAKAKIAERTALEEELALYTSVQEIGDASTPGLCLRSLNKHLLSVVFSFLPLRGEVSLVCKYWCEIMQERPMASRSQFVYREKVEASSIRTHLRQIAYDRSIKDRKERRWDGEERDGEDEAFAHYEDEQGEEEEEEEKEEEGEEEEEEEKKEDAFGDWSLQRQRLDHEMIAASRPFPPNSSPNSSPAPSLQSSTKTSPRISKNKSDTIQSIMRCSPAARKKIAIRDIQGDTDYNTRLTGLSLDQPSGRVPSSVGSNNSGQVSVSFDHILLPNPFSSTTGGTRTSPAMDMIHMVTHTTSSYNSSETSSYNSNECVHEDKSMGDGGGQKGGSSRHRSSFSPTPVKVRGGFRCVDELS